MLARRMAIALSGAGLLGAASTLVAEAAERQPFGSDRRLVEQAYRAFNQAFGSGRAIAALYAERGYLLPPTHDIIRGRTDIRTFWQGLFDAGVRGHALELITFRSDARTIVTAARWSAEGRDAQGRPVDLGGTATIVYARRQDGRLEIWLHTWN
jgi:ketosteroid isomerase-like protein